MFWKPRTIVRDYKNAGARDRGIQMMAMSGYAVAHVATYSGTFKKGKMLMTGGIGAFFLPGGARRSERYTVTFTKIEQ